jgi:hypothetical protein
LVHPIAVKSWFKPQREYSMPFSWDFEIVKRYSRHKSVLK